MLHLCHVAVADVERLPVGPATVSNSTAGSGAAVAARVAFCMANAGKFDGYRAQSSLQVDRANLLSFLHLTYSAARTLDCGVKHEIDWAGRRTHPHSPQVKLQLKLMQCKSLASNQTNKPTRETLRKRGSGRQREMEGN